MVGGEVDIVEADDRQVFRDRKAGRSRGRDGADGHLVVGGEDRARGLPPCQEPGRGPPARIDRPVPLFRACDRQAALPRAQQEASPALGREAVAGRTRDVGHRDVAEVGQEVGDVAARAGVVDAYEGDGITVDPLAQRDHGRRQQPFPPAGPRREGQAPVEQDHAVHGASVELTRASVGQAGVRPRVADQQDAPALPSGALDALEDKGEEGIADVRQQHEEHAGRLAAERPGAEIDRVAEFGARTLDPAQRVG